MNFRTVIEPPRHLGYLDHRQHLLLLGSCFVENIGLWLQQRKFDVDINPFGTLYNPESIARNWERIVSGNSFTPDALFQANGLWHSYDHHSRFSRRDRDEALTEMNSCLARAHDRLPVTDRIVITWGSAYIYRLKASGEVVANCHKQLATLFDRELLTVDAIVERWLPIVRYIESHLPACRLLFTVSPIRHLSDGAHGNQLSKATLLLAIDRLQHESRICDYFPSYEILMDDLRDYRFYDTDMTHPSASAITYISELLAESYLTPESREIASQGYKLYTAMNHRPNTGDTDGYKAFLQNTLDRVVRFGQAYPYINMTHEIAELNTRINQI